jgi:hypothetical protein
VWGQLAAKIPFFVSTFSEKAVGPVVSHNISPDELEKGQCQRMGGCGASSGFPKCVMGYDKHWRGVCCQIDTPDVHAGLSGVVVGGEAAPVATTRRDWSERGG